MFKTKPPKTIAGGRPASGKTTRVNVLSLLRSKTTPQTRHELEKTHNQRIIENMKGAM